MALRTLETKKGGLTSRSIRPGTILPSRLSRLFPSGQYAIEQFHREPRATTTVAGAGAGSYGPPTGATGDANFLHLQSMMATYSVLGAGQTLLAPTIDAVNGGLLIGLDAAVDEGVEYVLGGYLTAQNPFAVTVGTSPNSSVRATLRASVVAEAIELAVGWRKAEAFQALIDNYDEMAVLNVQSGLVFRETILNAGATVSVDTLLTAVDATDFSLEVRLIGRKAVMFFNGEEAPIGAPFSFDVGEVVVPFIHFLQGPADPCTLHAVDLEVGPLYVNGIDPARK